MNLERLFGIDPMTPPTPRDPKVIDTDAIATNFIADDAFK